MVAPPPPVSAEEQAPAIEAQVDALLDQAEKQVQSMSELVDEPAPQPAPAVPAETTAPTTPAAETSSPAETTTTAPAAPKADEAKKAPEPSTKTEPTPPTKAEPTSPAPIDPLDTKALQGQVDAILAEAGQPIEGDIDDQASEPEAVEDEPTASDSDEQDEAAEIDIADVDAVIADAAQRAIEEDDFETNASTRDEADDPAALAASAAAAAPAKPKAVLKGGDASKRRDKPKGRRPKGADLDGGPAAPSKESRNTSGETDSDADARMNLEPEPLDPRLRARVARYTLHRMAVINAPWHTWPPLTRYAVLAFTILNLSLAAAAYMVLLRRWF